MPPSLVEWETFYVITGSGAALTGLMFVVIALAADRLPLSKRGGPSVEMGAFSTPTVVHFGLVLVVASVMSIPHATIAMLATSLAACALYGLVNGLIIVVRMRRLEQYEAVPEDWVWYAGLPFVAYAALLTAAFMLSSFREAALLIVAAVVLLLLLIGIHNAWDIALFTATYRERPGNEPGTDAPAETRPASEN